MQTAEHPRIKHLNKSHLAIIARARSFRLYVLTLIPKGELVNPIRAGLLWDAVVNDYGYVTERRIYRALEWLLATKRIVRVRPPGTDSSQWGYFRKR